MWYSTVEGGYITLVSVLIVGAIGITITLSLILLGIESSRTTFSADQSHQGRALVNACTEEALELIRTTTSFTGSGNLTLPQGSCSYTVANQGAENRVVNASGSVGTNVRKVKVIISKINPTIQIVSWQEVADF